MRFTYAPKTLKKAKAFPEEGKATMCRPDANRTRNPQLRRLVLYPVELRAQDDFRLPIADF